MVHKYVSFHKIWVFLIICPFNMFNFSLMASLIRRLLNQKFWLLEDWKQFLEASVIVMHPLKWIKWIHNRLNSRRPETSLNDSWHFAFKVVFQISRHVNHKISFDQLRSKSNILLFRYILLFLLLINRRIFMLLKW